MSGTTGTTGTAGAVSRRLRHRHARRTATVVGGLVLLLAALATVALLLGDAALTPAEVGSALVGQAEPVVRFVVVELRLPRLLTAVVVGLCLGASGAVFQSVVRNPLASPDIVGITASAGATGVVGVVLLGLSGAALSGTVLAGALVAALLVYALAWRQGVQGYRLVLVGIGVAAFATAATSYVLTRADVRDAQVAYAWLTGSLNGAAWGPFVTLAASAVVLLALLAAQTRALRALELGDDAAAGLGTRAERARLLLVLTAVALAAVAVAASGPIAFVALMAAPIARRLVGATGVTLTASALVGAAILSASDLVAQFAVPGTSYPVGVVTGLVGAPYLVWLLARTNRTGAGG